MKEKAGEEEENPSALTESLANLTPVFGREAVTITFIGTSLSSLDLRYSCCNLSARNSFVVIDFPWSSNVASCGIVAGWIGVALVSVDLEGDRIEAEFGGSLSTTDSD